MRTLKRILRGLLVVLTALILLLITAVFLIRMPSVQNKAVTWLTPTLEKAIGGANVEIGFVDLDFFDAFSIENLLVEDLNGDTLAYAASIHADFGVFSLLNSSLVIDEFVLDGAIVKMNQYRQDSSFNYQFIVDALATSEDDAVSKTSSGFDFGVNKANLSNLKLVFIDEKEGIDMDLLLDELMIEVDALSLDELSFTFDEILVSGLTSNVRVAEVSDVHSVDLDPDKNKEHSWPTLGFPVAIQNLVLEAVNVQYHDERSEAATEGLDPANLGFEDLGLKASQLVWDRSQVAFDLDVLQFKERSGLQVEEMSLGLVLTPNQLTIDNLMLASKRSRFQATTQLRFPDFEALVNVSPALELSLKLEESSLAFQDLKLFSPMLENTGINLDADTKIETNAVLHGTLGTLVADRFELAIGSQTSLAFRGKLFDINDPKQISFDLNEISFLSSPEEINTLVKSIELPRELNRFGAFNFSGSIAGSSSKFRGRDLKLATAGTTSFKGDLALDKIDALDHLKINADVRELRTSAEEIVDWIPSSDAFDFNSLGEIDFTGRYSGTLQDFMVDGRLVTAIGKVKADLNARFSEDYSTAKYAGQVEVDTFQLDQFLRDSTFGPISIAAYVDGSGLNPSSVSTKLKSTIESFTFMGYTYPRHQGRRSFFAGDF